MSEKLKLEFDTKLKLQQVQIQRLIDETIDLKMQIKCLRRENDDLQSDKRKMQDKYRGLRRDYDGLECYCAKISQDKVPPPPSKLTVSNVKIKDEPSQEPFNQGPSVGSFNDPTPNVCPIKPSTDNFQDRLHAVSPSDDSSVNVDAPLVNKPFRYEPANRADYEAYIDRNHICMTDLCRHYNICETSRNSGQSILIDCYYAKHPKHRYLHVEHILHPGSHSYSKQAALCQASEKYCDYWDPLVAVKLYAAINEDRDGFFD